MAIYTTHHSCGRRALTLLAVCLFGCSTSAPPDAPEPSTKVIEAGPGPAGLTVAKVRRALTAIGEVREINGRSIGTGIIIGEKYALTCAHVVGTRPAVELTLWDEGTGRHWVVAAKVVAKSPIKEYDLALLELGHTPAKYVPVEVGPPMERGMYYAIRVFHSGVPRVIWPIYTRGNTVCFSPGDRLLPGDSGSGIFDAEGRLRAIARAGRVYHTRSSFGKPINLVAGELNLVTPSQFIRTFLDESGH